MAAMRVEAGHMELKHTLGNSVEPITQKGVEWKKITVKAARFIFRQRNKDGYV